jgi:cytochrome P450
MQDLQDLVCIGDPAFYDVDNAPVLAKLRNEAPVYFHEPANTWILSKYEDIKFAERTPELFTVRQGTLLNDARFGRNVEEAFFDEGAELISTLDPPRHGEIRRTIAPAFTPRCLANLEDSVRSVTRDLINGIEEGKEIEFVTQIAQIIPTQAVAQLVGIPAGEIDVSKIIFWADELFKVGAPLPPGELAIAAANVREMKGFFLDLFDRKRKNPSDDLMSAIALAQQNRAGLSEANIVTLAEMVVTAGIDTTRNTLSAVMWSLARHREQMRALAEDPSLIQRVVEEVLRWITPVPGFARNATREVEVRGTPIRQGDYVFLLYFAANRDEDQWTDPDIFDITRPPEPGVLSFGFGQHVCIGAGLARMEVRVFLEELLRRFSVVDVSGEPRRVPSPMQHGWSALPLTFGR